MCQKATGGFAAAFVSLPKASISLRAAATWI
ncbi:MAG: hypothetical protein P8Y58_11025 [Novosphingobium sp.]